MKKLSRYFISILLLSFLAGCNSTNNKEGDIFQYNGTLVGDNSAVGGIITQLPFGDEYYKQFELQTKEEPYGITIKYNKEEKNPVLNDVDMKELAICNSTYIFALVDNAAWVKYDFGNPTLTVTKEELEAWYGKELSIYKNEKDIRELLQEHLSDKNNITQFFDKE